VLAGCELAAERHSRAASLLAANLRDGDRSLETKSQMGEKKSAASAGRGCAFLR